MITKQHEDDMFTQNSSLSSESSSSASAAAALDFTGLLELESWICSNSCFNLSSTHQSINAGLWLKFGQLIADLPKKFLSIHVLLDFFWNSIQRLFWQLAIEKFGILFVGNKMWKIRGVIVCIPLSCLLKSLAVDVLLNNVSSSGHFMSTITTLDFVWSGQRQTLVGCQ